MIEYNIRLNMNQAAAVNTGLKFKSGDRGVIFVILVDGMDTSNTTAKIVFKRSNGTSVEAAIAEGNGVYSYKTLGNEFAVPGKTVADVKFYAEDDRVSTASFVFEVGSDTMDGLGTGTGGYSDTLEQLMKDIEAARADMEQVVQDAEKTQEDMDVALQKFVEDFAVVGTLNPRGAWNENKTYNLRDIVHYLGSMWIGLGESTGETPSEDSTAWMLAVSGGDSGAELEAILNGTTQVGDSKKLGSLTAEEWQEKIDAVGKSATNAANVADLANKKADEIANGITPAGDADKFGGLTAEEWEAKIESSGGSSGESSGDTSGLQTAIEELVDGTTPAGDSKRLNGKEASCYAEILLFENMEVPTDAWVEDETYTDSGFMLKADITCEGVTEKHFADVTLSVPDAVSGNYAPVVSTGDGMVTVYAKEIPTDVITIPSIKCVKGGDTE